MSVKVELFCFKCNNKLTFNSGIGRKEECPHCRSDVHCCRNCRFYDPKSYNECTEPSAEVVRDKDRSNFCDYFEATSLERQNNKQDLLSAAEALFKKN